MARLIVWQEETHTLSGGPVSLSIQGDDLGYTLSYSEQGGGSKALAQVESKLLSRSPPIGNTFTGVMFGVYAFGKMEPVLDPADFSGIEVETGSS